MYHICSKWALFSTKRGSWWWVSALCPVWMGVPEDKEGTGRVLAYELEALCLFTAAWCSTLLNLAFIWHWAKPNLNLNPWTLLITSFFMKRLSLLPEYRSLTIFALLPSQTQAVLSQFPLKVFLLPPAPKNTGVLQTSLIFLHRGWASEHFKLQENYVNSLNIFLFVDFWIEGSHVS